MKHGPLEALQEVIDRVAQQIRPGLAVNAYLAGGLATYVHLTQSTHHPPDRVRYSEDADIQFEQMGRSINIPDDIVVAYQDIDGVDRVLTLDRTYSIDIGLRHPDVFDDAIHLLDSGNGRLHLQILTPVDLAITKTGRFQEHDRDDIQMLARAGLLNADEFKSRARVAVDYLATDPKRVLFNIEDAVELIRKSEK